MKIFCSLIAAVTAAPLLAQTINTSPTPAPTAAAEAAIVPHSQSVLDAITHAGPVMYALVALSIFSLMLVITYLMTIRRGAVVSSGFMATADALLRKRDYLGLLAVSNR